MDNILDLLRCCRLCPRNCGVNRLEGQLGYCSSDSHIKAARASLHMWEEPCISGKNGSGTVFFSNCNLKCVFCQNNSISTGGKGNYITEERLGEIFLEQQNRGAHNINLVTPTHYVPQIIEGIKYARGKGLKIPVVYNSGGYENVETIKALEGYVDIYLPDLKYYNDKYAIKYSGAPGYFKAASKAIDEMVKQVGKPVFDQDGMMKKGVIIRHLMLPGLLFDSKKIVDFIHSDYGDNVYLSLMNQYTPMNVADTYPELNRPVSSKHYDSLIDYCLRIGIVKGFIQEEGTVSESFIPDFDGRGIVKLK